MSCLCTIGALACRRSPSYPFRLVPDRLPPPSPGAGGREAGSVGGSGGGSPGAGGVGDIGGGSPASATGGAGRLVSGTARAPENLVAVGRLVGNIQCVQASGGISLNADVETRLTDLYKISPWWLELPDVEDVMNQQRRKILVEAIPLGDPSTATLASMHLQQEGRAIYHRYTIALYRGGQDFFGVVVGCVCARAFVYSFSLAPSVLEQIHGHARTHTLSLSVCLSCLLSLSLSYAHAYNHHHNYTAPRRCGLQMQSRDGGSRRRRDTTGSAVASEAPGSWFLSSAW